MPIIHPFAWVDRGLPLPSTGSAHVRGVSRSLVPSPALYLDLPHFAHSFTLQVHATGTDSCRIASQFLLRRVSYSSIDFLLICVTSQLRLFTHCVTFSIVWGPGQALLAAHLATFTFRACVFSPPSSSGSSLGWAQLLTISTKIKRSCSCCAMSAKEPRRPPSLLPLPSHHCAVVTGAIGLSIRQFTTTQTSSKRSLISC